MNLDDDDLRFRPSRPDPRSVLPATLAVAFVLAVAFLALPDLPQYAQRTLVAGKAIIGILPPDDEYGAAYDRLKIARLPPELLASPKISKNLARLAHETCDRAAIVALGEGLVAEHESRRAAEAYLGYAGLCPNSDPQQSAAANILIGLGDGARALALADDLIARNPIQANYRYLRGRALVGLARYPEALVDYRSTIELQKNPTDVFERVFVEMANIFVAMGRPCDAVTTILTYVALDPGKRDTPQARKMVAEYAARGCAQERSATDPKSL